MNPAAATVQVNPQLLEAVVRVGHFSSKEAAAESALQEYLSRHQPEKGYRGDPQEIIDLFGTVDFDPTYDYKAERMRDLKRIPVDEDDHR